MNGHPADMRSVAFSVGVYRLLLSAYPASFRQEYGPHMLQVFRDYCLRTARRGGHSSLLRLWAITLLDLAGSLIEQHTRKETYMTQDKWTRAGGWMLMLGAITFVFYFIALDTEAWQYGAALLLGTNMFLAGGLLGMRDRYAKELGSAGSGLLRAGAIGGLLWSLTAFIPEIDRLGETGWIIPISAPAIPLACLAAMGVLAVRQGVFPLGRGLSILGGVWFPGLILVYLLVTLMHNLGILNLLNLLRAQDILSWISVVGTAIQTIALLGLGYRVQAGASPQSVAA